MELAALDKQISELNKQRSILMKESKKEIIASLDWVGDFSARLQIQPLQAAGISKYKILLFGKEKAPYCSCSVTVMGDSRFYEQNILYSSTGLFSSLCDQSVPCFYTSSDNMLFQFLESVTFKEFNFDRETLKFLKRIQDISEKYNA